MSFLCFIDYKENGSFRKTHKYLTDGSIFTYRTLKKLKVCIQFKFYITKVETNTCIQNSVNVVWVSKPRLLKKFRCIPLLFNTSYHFLLFSNLRRCCNFFLTKSLWKASTTTDLKVVSYFIFKVTYNGNNVNLDFHYYDFFFSLSESITTILFYYFNNKFEFLFNSLFFFWITVQPLLFLKFYILFPLAVV